MGILVLALAIWAVGPWVKIQVGVTPQVEMAVVEIQKNEDRLLLTYEAYNGGHSGPVDLVRTVRYRQSMWEKNTLVMPLEAGETLLRQDEFRVPNEALVEEFEITLAAEQRWLPFKW